MESEKLVTAAIVSKELGVPIATVYRLARAERIPYVDKTKAWHSQRRFLFHISEVKAALDKMGADRG